MFGYAINLHYRKNRLHPYICWVFAVAVLLFKESYRLQNRAGCYFLRFLFDQRYSGGFYSWRLPVNFLVLRIISYNMDSHWAILHKASGKEEEAPDDALALVEGEYSSLWNYLAYIIYAPLYIAGPIMTFNSFTRSMRDKRPSTESVALYALRWLACLVLMEFLTSQFPFFAVISSNLLPSLSLHETALLFYLTLKMMWVKFLLIWRFFRLWSMAADELQPPENMRRCMSNNCSLEQFWSDISKQRNIV